MAAQPRRSTRLSIARFSFSSRAAAAAAAAPPVPDIEDVIGNTPRAARSTGSAATTTTSTTTAARKRKRATSPATAATGGEPAVELQETAAATSSSSPKPAPTPRRARKPARIATAPGPVTGAPAATATAAAAAVTEADRPFGWREVYAVAKEMRTSGAAANAAVDTMGCERLALAGASARDRRFHTLVALMLSSQTKDTVNAEAMARLHAELPACAPGRPAGLTLDNVLAVEPELLNELIGKVGFHNNKTKYIKQAACLLRDLHGSDIPDTVEGLMALPGVGPKMAHLCMSADNGWGRVEGIGVDVHVHRITNLWGWQSPATRTPEDTRRALEAWLPRDRWKEINWLLVGLGQSVCLPVGRRCGDCDLGLRGLCRAADRAKVSAGRRRREEEEKKKKMMKAREGEGRGNVGGLRDEEDEVKGEGVKDEGGEGREEGIKVEEDEQKDGMVKVEAIKKEEKIMISIEGGYDTMAKLEETTAATAGEAPFKKEEDAKSW